MPAGDKRSKKNNLVPNYRRRSYTTQMGDKSIEELERSLDEKTKTGEGAGQKAIILHGNEVVRDFGYPKGEGIGPGQRQRGRKVVGLFGGRVWEPSYCWNRWKAVSRDEPIPGDESMCGGKKGSRGRCWRGRGAE